LFNSNNLLKLVLLQLQDSLNLHLEQLNQEQQQREEHRSEALLLVLQLLEVEEQEELLLLHHQELQDLDMLLISKRWLKRINQKLTVGVFPSRKEPTLLLLS
jgi:hypothetical protein